MGLESQPSQIKDLKVGSYYSQYIWDRLMTGWLRVWIVWLKWNGISFWCAFASVDYHVKICPWLLVCFNVMVRRCMKYLDIKYQSVFMFGWIKHTWYIEGSSDIFFLELKFSNFVVLFCFKVWLFVRSEHCTIPQKRLFVWKWPLWFWSNVSSQSKSKLHQAIYLT